MPNTNNSSASTHTSVGIHSGVAITVQMPLATEVEMAALCIGSDEALRIDSADVAGLENLRDMADEAIRRLRARIDANAQSRVMSSARL